MVIGVVGLLATFIRIRSPPQKASVMSLEQQGGATTRETFDVFKIWREQ